MKNHLNASSQELIYEDIKKGLLAGKFSNNSDMQLPSLRVLAAQYGSSVGTVRQALVKLEFEKYIRAGHGKGYFIIPPEQKLKQVIVIERSGEPHLFSGFLNQFQKYFSSFPNISISVEDPRLMNRERSLSILKRIRENPDDFEAMFFDTQTFEGNFTDNELQEIMGKIKLFHYFHTSDKCRELKIPGISTDWHHGGYIGTKHLIEIGCRNILLISHIEFDFTEGCREAITDSTCKTCLTFNNGKNIPALKNLFSENPFDAVFAFGDSRILPLIPMLKELNLKIPEDIALLGFYNTPWVNELTEVPLSSISIREDEMINELCDMCLGNSVPCQKILKPKLITRESTINFRKTRK